MNNQISIVDYPIPDSTEIEKQVIADIISIPSVIASIDRIVTDNLFSCDEYRHAWQTIMAAINRNETIDLPSMYGKLGKNIIQSILPYMKYAIGDMSAIQHSLMLKDMYVKRKTYAVLTEALRDISNISKQSDETLIKVTKSIDAINNNLCQQSKTQHITAAVNALGDKIETRALSKATGKILRVPTGFKILDYLLYGGFECGNLAILAARPSVGKTAIMLHMAKAAAKASKACCIFSLEMTNTELAQRMIVSTDIITPSQIAKGTVIWNDFERASDCFTSLPLYLCDSSYDIDEIASQIILNHKAGKCDIAMIDYLGLINMQLDRNISKNYAIEAITKRLKQVAKNCEIPIVLLCQLSRDVAKEKRAPVMTDLRDSGSIEQDADIILMLHKVEPRKLEMWVRKNRQGQAGEVKIDIYINETYTNFSDDNVQDINFVDGFNQNSFE